MSEEEDTELRLKLAQLEIEHEDLSHAIDALIQVGCDPLRLQRFKKKKLALKDEITRLSNLVMPDIIA